MKWYQTIILACGLAIIAPQISMAQPGHPGQHNDHHNGVHPGNHGKDSDKKADKKDDRGPQHNHPGMNHPNNQGHPGMNHPNNQGHPGADKNHPVPPHHPGMKEMDPREFSHLLNSISKPAVGANKLARIRAAAKSNYFTADQVRQLMKAVRMENDKISVAVELYRRVIDRHNWHVIYSALTFAASKHEIDRRLGL